MLMKTEDIAWNDFWSSICDAPKEHRLAMLQSFDSTITPDTLVSEVKKRYKESVKNASSNYLQKQMIYA